MAGERRARPDAGGGSPATTYHPIHSGKGLPMPEGTNIFDALVDAWPAGYVQEVAARMPALPVVEPVAGEGRHVLEDPLTAGPVVVPGLVGSSPVVPLNERLTSLRAQRAAVRS